MKNQRLKKTISALAVFFMLIMLVPVQALGSETASTDTADTENMTYTISFDKIEEDILTRSPDVKENKDDYEEGDKGVVAKCNLDEANKNIVWEIQNQYFEYNDLQKQMNMAKAKKTLLEYEYQLTKIKNTYGEATSEELLAAQKNVTDQDNTMISLQKQIDDILEDFHYQFALDDKVNIIVSGVPYQAVQFSGIDYNADLEQALKNSYDITVADWNGDNVAYAETIRNFKSSFKAAYDDLKTAVDQVDYNEQYISKDMIAFKLAGVKYNYGAITKLEYLTAENTYLSTQIGYDQDKNDLMKAYIKYDWAKKGLIVN